MKLTGEIIALIEGIWTEEQFTKALERANLALESTKLVTTSAKIDKGNTAESEYINGAVYLPPSDSSGKNICTWATPGCRLVCLGIGSGRMNFGKDILKSREFDWSKTDTAKAQKKRLDLFFNNRNAYRAQLFLESYQLVVKARKLGKRAAIRLNATSDLLWEKLFPELFAAFPMVAWYDYTKAPINRRDTSIPNYHLTYSYADGEANHNAAIGWLESGANVAMVFDTRRHDPLPTTHTINGISYTVIDGDIDDRRYLDPKGVIVGLRAKGAAIHDTSGFVIRLAA